jgi:HSP20 family protein
MFDIVRRDPFGQPLRDLMSVIVREPFGGLRWQEDSEGTLPLDIAAGDGELIVKASLPGFKREDIDVQLHNGVLSIKAEQTREAETAEARFYRKERRFGSVSRRIALPGVVAEASANAEFQDGVLTLRIPQAEIARPKQIQIN